MKRRPRIDDAVCVAINAMLHTLHPDDHDAVTAALGASYHVRVNALPWRRRRRVLQIVERAAAQLSMRVPEPRRRRR